MRTMAMMMTVGLAMAIVACGNGGTGSTSTGAGAGSTTGSPAGTGGSSTNTTAGVGGNPTTGIGGNTTTTTADVSASSGSGMTSSVTLTGTIDSNPDPSSVLSPDNTTLATIYTGSVSTYTVTPPVSDELDLSQASSYTLEMPTLGNCSADQPTISLGTDNATLQFFGQDTLPATDCIDFAKSIHSNGIKAHFTNVPFFNGGSVADVEVDFTP